MGRYRSTPSRLRDQMVSPLWDKVLSTMRAWMDAQDAHRETNGEDDAILEQV